MPFTEVLFEIPIFFPLSFLWVQVQVLLEGFGVLVQLIARPTLHGFVVGRVEVNGRVQVE